MNIRYKRIKDILSHSGVKGKKWGVLNGPPYPLNSAVWARKISSDAKKHEASITRDVSDAAKATRGKLHGMEHKLKTYASIKRKIETDAEEKRTTISKAARDLKDANRYTLLSDNDSFVSDYETFKQNLIDKGYKEVRCRNYFEDYRLGKVKHKAVQSVFETPDGYRFEMQFHTPASQRAKDKKVPIYEERRKPGLSYERQLELERQMDLLAANVPVPNGVERIKSH